MKNISPFLLVFAFIACRACPVGQYMPSGAGQCRPCRHWIPNCVNCINNGGNLECTGCDPGYTLWVNVSTSCTPPPPPPPPPNPCISMANCIGCSSSTFCTTCSSTQFYLLNANATHQSCSLCSTGIPNCLTCLSGPLCTSCIDNTFYVNAVGGCSLCSSSPLADCLECKSISPTQLQCLLCVNSSFFINSTSECEPCSAAITNCQQCTTSTFCSTCVNDTFYPKPAGPGIQSCDLCSSAIPDCLTCTKHPLCTSCVNTTIFVNSSGGCTLCADYLLNCVECYSDWTGPVPPVRCSLCLNVTYFIGPSYYCELCTSTNINCTTCLNESYCLTCRDDHTYLHAVSSSIQLCFRCQVSMPNCLICNGGAICTSCVSNSFALDASGSTCSSCGSLLSNCLQCSSNWSAPAPHIRCSLCSPGFFSNHNFQCQLCSSVINNCSKCTNDSLCTECVSNLFAFFSNVTQCLLCSDQFPNCQECNENKCTLCPPGLIFGYGRMSCECVLGTMASGVCMQVEGCNDAKVDGSGKKICLGCDPTYFQPTPVNNVCLCKEGTLIGKICSTVQGCITPYILPGGNVGCLFCNITRGYKLFPVNGDCLCPPEYNQTDGFCKQICGDGLYMGEFECDDGNLDGGDGCSSSCKVEVGYRCQNGTATQPSACVYQGIPLTLELKTIRKSEQLDQGHFKFTIAPAILTLRLMDFAQHVSLTCQDTTYWVSNVEYFSTGQLTLTVDYTTDMEGRPCTLGLSFDSNVIISPNVTMNFEAVSDTKKLVIINQKESYEKIKSIYQYIAFAAAAVFVLSLSHKMIGAETSTCLQFVYLSNALYRRQYFFFDLLKNMGLVTGTWPLFYNESDALFMPPFSDRVTMTPIFLQNNIAVTAVLLIFGVVITILSIKNAFKNNHDAEQQQKITEKQKQNMTKIQKTIKYLYRIILFPFAAGFIVVTMISVYIDTLGLKNSYADSIIPQSVNSLMTAIAVLIISSVCAVEFNSGPAYNADSDDTESGGLQDAKPWYVRLFLLRSVVYIIVIELGVTHMFDVLAYPLAFLQLAYLFFIIFGRPYANNIHNIGIVFCEMTTAYAFALPIATRFLTFSEKMQVFTALTLQGLICLVLLFSLIRIVFHCKKIITEVYCVKSDEQQKQIAEGSEQIKVLDQLDQKKKEKLRKKTKSKKNKVLERIAAEQKGLQIEMASNPYSLYTKKQHGGIERLLPKVNRHQKQQRFRVNTESPRRLSHLEQEDNEEVSAIKQRLREDLLLKKRQQVNCD